MCPANSSMNRGARANESMPEEMPSSHFRPIGAGKGSLQMVVSLVRGQRLDGPRRSSRDSGGPPCICRRASIALMSCRRAPLLASPHDSRLAEKMRSARMILQPLPKDFLEYWRNGNPPRRRLTFHPFLFMDCHDLLTK